MIKTGLPEQFLFSGKSMVPDSEDGYPTIPWVEVATLQERRLTKYGKWLQILMTLPLLFRRTEALI